jgi:hypothetical protein
MLVAFRLAGLSPPDARQRVDRIVPIEGIDIRAAAE